jgi:acyl carrier protein
MATDEAALKERVKALIIQCARLKVPASQIRDDTLLFDAQKGLGLDSIDVLEIVVNLEREHGVVVPDRETGQKVLQSVNSIVDFIRSSGKGP